MLIDEFKEYLLLRRGMSFRTMIAYGKDIELFLSFLADKELEIGQVTSKELRIFLNQLKKRGIGSSLYLQIFSALKLLGTFLKEKYFMTNLTFDECEIVAGFPIACSPEDIFRVLGRLTSSLEDLRLKLLIRLLYAYKIPLNKLSHCIWAPKEIGLLLDGKNIPLMPDDILLAQEYKKKLTASLGPNYLLNLQALAFVIQAKDGGARGISKRALGSLLERAFTRATHQWFMEHKSISLNDESDRTSHDQLQGDRIKHPRV